MLLQFGEPLSRAILLDQAHSLAILFDEVVRLAVRTKAKEATDLTLQVVAVALKLPAQLLDQLLARLGDSAPGGWFIVLCVCVCVCVRACVCACVRA